MGRGWAAAICAVLGTLSCAAPVYATYPGDNGRIAFLREDPPPRGIYTSNELGTNVTQVVPYADADNPSWSPDGSKLAFSHAGDIYTINPDGSGETLLLDWNHIVAGITWSPDGTRLAAALGNCNDGECRSDIYTLNTDGTQVVDLTPDLLDDRNPDWAPDGSKIAFDSPRGGQRQIIVMNPDGTGQTALTNTPGNEQPSWAPDASKLAFTSTRNGAQEIYGMRPDGSQQGLLSRSSQFGDASHSAVYSPDGSQLLFSGYYRDVVQALRLYRMSATGSTPVRVTNGWDKQVDWGIAPSGATVFGYYARPRGATPVVAHLVPAYARCEVQNADRVHGPPLAFQSCNPPAQVSPRLTIGTADANGRPTRGLSRLHMEVYRGAPTTTGDEADVAVVMGVQDVYRTSNLTDYNGGLELRLSVRITDRDNFPVNGDDAGGTMEDLDLSVPLACGITADPQAGGVCFVDTTLDSLVPGIANEGARAVWELGQVGLYDAGADGDPESAGDNELFQVQGLLVP